MSIDICSNIITSNDYIDLIVHSTKAEGCYQKISDDYYVKYIRKPSERLSVSEYGYEAIPKVFGLCDTSSIEEVGAIKTSNNATLGFTGKNVIVGIVDTGIDFRHETFLDENGRTRVLGIWDQSVEGSAPEGFLFGSYYSKEMLDSFLTGNNSVENEPVDDNGHGTFLAGIACGSENEYFRGVAPDAYLMVVKLKQAKDYLREYYYLPEGVNAYSECDIMLGISFVKEMARQYNMPYVILLGLGSWLGGHNGGLALEKYLDDICDESGAVVVVPTGNEGNERGHFNDVYKPFGKNVVEINLGNERGLYTELWASVPDRYSLNIISPSGNKIFAYPYLSGKTREYVFELEATRVYVDYIKVEALSGGSVIILSFDNPANGLWQIEIEGDVIDGRYNMWLPMREFLQDETFFIGSNPYITLTVPSTAKHVITVGGYDHRQDIFDIDSGRGYTTEDVVKPELVAPDLRVYGPNIVLNNSYGYLSGTSIAAAHVAGCAALLMEWSMVRRNKTLTCSEIKSYLIRGAKRSIQRMYPNEEYGYGEVDIYNVFVEM